MLVLFLFVVAFAAFVVSAVSGGGAGLVLVPLLRTMLPIASVPAALSIGTAASSAARMATFGRSIRWDVVRLFVPSALPAAALGAWLLTRFEPAYIEFLLGCFLLANLPALFRREAPEPATVRPLPRSRLRLIGAAAGLLSGFTGAVGLIFNRSYHRMGLAKEEIVATRATNEILLHLLKIGLYAGFGLLDRPALVAGALIAVAAILASVAMRWLLPLIKEAAFRRVGLAAMVASGAALFAMSGSQIVRMHDAWVRYTAPDGEHQVEANWRGVGRFAAELEREGHVVFERQVALADLPPATRAAIVAAVPLSRITFIEEVRGPDGASYEVHYLDGGRVVAREVTAPAPRAERPAPAA
ncbi:sulfite exporter TauE/SafE family protein [Sphingomonas sp. Tas61C01]|uniref:sulfite exporter TauE/SafE family protein n=1 Tax=Sphingomonas sp. Tas61C01 TaxID=3458297 RepID=UPI00403E4EAB